TQHHVEQQPRVQHHAPAGVRHVRVAERWPTAPYRDLPENDARRIAYIRAGGVHQTKQACIQLASIGLDLTRPRLEQVRASASGLVRRRFAVTHEHGVALDDRVRAGALCVADGWPEARMIRETDGRRPTGYGTSRPPARVGRAARIDSHRS